MIIVCNGKRVSLKDLRKDDIFIHYTDDMVDFVGMYRVLREEKNGVIVTIPVHFGLNTISFDQRPRIKFNKDGPI